MAAFDRLHPALQHQVVNALGWRSLRPVQDLAIDAALEGANLLVLAPTAGGKTEAAFFPLISEALSRPWGGAGRALRQPDQGALEQPARAAGAVLRPGRPQRGALARRRSGLGQEARPG